MAFTPAPIPTATRKLVHIGDQHLELGVPADPDAVMQSCWDAHGEDEAYFPFWLELWPSSLGLYDFLVRNRIDLGGALELGCGNGALAQLLADLPGTIMHSDLVPSAVRFTAKQLGPRPDRLAFAMDMEKPALAKKPKLLFAADVFYEYRLVDMVCRFVQTWMERGGIAYIADPERPSRPLVSQHVADSGVAAEKISWTFTLDGAEKWIAVWKLTAPLASP